MAETIKIGGELESTATGNVVAAASAIKDKVKNKYQDEINAETDATLNNHASAIQGLNSQNYVTVTATDQTTDVTDVLPATGAANTVYRVGNWNGSQFDANVYSEYAWNGSQYVHLSTKTQIGEVFDISAYHATGGTLATYADLSAALDSNNGGGVPQSLQKGGMSVKFVQSSDNKYIQSRCMAQNFTTDVTQWQNVGDFLEEKEISYSEEDVAGYITDKKCTIIGKLMKSGAVEWTVKNSRDIFVDGKISDIEESIQGVSGNLSTQTERIDELDENAIREVEIDDTEENVAAYITGKNGVIIAKIMKDGSIERTVKNESDKIIDTLVRNVNELYGKTLQESVIEISEEGVVGYVTDKNKAILAKINQNGSIDRLVENDKDKHTVHFEDVDIEGIVNLLTDKNNNIVASINDKAEVDFYGGGGFAGEKIVDANTFGYNKLIISRNNVVVGGIKPDGTVKMFKVEIDDLNYDNIDVKALIKSLPIIVSGLDNIEISNDKRVMNLLTSVNTSKVVEVQGENIKSKLKPCISIIDDDTIDNQIPSSRGTTVPVANQGGYFSVLLPFILSLSAKYNKSFSVGLACEGHRVGLTPMASSSDDYTELNENGRCVKWLHDNVGWNVFNHSMTAQLPQQAYYVDGINSSLAQRIISEYTGSYYAPFSFNNLCVIDRTTGKWYELNNQSQSAWFERTPTKKYAMPFYKDYDTKAWYFNREFDFEYSWGEWCRRAKELGLPYEKVIVHNGSTSSIYMANASRKYANFSVRTNGIHNYPPIPATVSRMTTTAGTTGNVRSATYENSMKAEVDKCFNNHTWMVFMTHFNDPTHYNYYVDGVTYPDGVNNYPSEWILPLKYEEIEDIIGSNTNDYINHPPSRLNIQSWDEWYPAPGTKIKSLYDVLDYAIQKGVEFVSPIDGWNTHGNMLNIGADRNGQTYPYDSAEGQTPYTEEEQSFLTIGADGSIRYFSK